ncbi:MAG: Uma2 family endonuclease [Pseudomonadota bacterium]|nr:Uma2 family endonuclease [Pseudomonadota bacterium]
MGEPARALPTFEELYREIAALPEGMTGEILGPGWLRTMSRPGQPHGRASRRLLRSLRGSDLLEDGTGWWFEVEAEILLGDRLVVPDISGWRAEQELDFGGENPITVRPDWVCEILSRGTQRGDRAVKLPVYAAEGVGHVWIVDPEAATIEVYASQDGKAVLVDTAIGNVRRTLAPFPDEIDVGGLWKPARKPDAETPDTGSQP